MSHNEKKFLLLRARWIPIFLAAFALLSVALPHASAQSSDKIVEELPAGAMQAKATTSCLECHESRIILQQRLSKAAWTKEVDKMIKWGALVDANDREPLIDYLSTNFSPEKPAYQPSRSAPAKNVSAKKSK
ncbi:MAG: hypothetical protein DMG79_15455 [Acidobacteria bacterium]|nr:MAG: hypothetical protein DMG79_15455 [Acidobacteriota bacterium]